MNSDYGLSDLKVLEDIGSILMIADDDRRFIYLNKEAENFLSVFGDEICSKLSCHAPDSLSGPYAESRHISLENSHGEIHDFCFTRIPLGSGRFLCIGSEITSADGSSERLPDIIQSVTEHLPSGIIITDQQLQIKYANLAAVNMLRLGSRSDWFNLKVYEAFAGKLIGDFCVMDGYKCPFNRLMTTGEAFTNELFCAGSQDGTSYISINGSISRDIAGRINGIVCTLEDCTEVSITRSLLAKSESKYRMLTEFSPSGITAFKGSKIVYMNPAGAEIFGFAEGSEMQGRNILDFLAPPDRLKAAQVVGDMIRLDKPFHGMKLSAFTADKKKIDLRVSCQPYDDGSGKAVQCVFSDITLERKRTEEILRLSQVVEQSPVSVIITDLTGKIEYINPAALSLTGYTAEEVTGKNVNLFRSGSHPDEYYKNLWETIQAGGTWKGELCNQTKDGVSFWEFCTVSPVKDLDGEMLFYVAVKENITEKKIREEEMKFMALHDLLTGLPNRFLMRDRLEYALERYRRYGEKLAVMFIDLDGFKNINDRYGHDAGDALLKEVSKRILGCIRSTDTACRIGGDEFLVIVTDISAGELLDEVAKRLLHAIGQPFDYQGKECRVGASIGIGLCPEDGVNVDDLIIRADEAMYYVKRRTKNSFAYFLDLPK